MINTYIQLDGSDNYDEFYNKFYQLLVTMIFHYL